MEKIHILEVKNAPYLIKYSYGEIDNEKIVKISLPGFGCEISEEHYETGDLVNKLKELGWKRAGVNKLVKKLFTCEQYTIIDPKTGKLL